MAEWKNGIAKLTVPTPFSVGDVHTYLIKGDRLTLVDAGVKTEQAWHQFKDQLAQLNLTPEDIDQVILTHHHPDHVGLLHYWPSPVEVYAHPLSERGLSPANNLYTMSGEFFERAYARFGVPEEHFQKMIEESKKLVSFIPDISLTGYLSDEDIPLGLPGWQVLETKGHAQDHISLWREKDGTLIGGDVLIAHISPNPFMEPPHPGEEKRPKSQLQYNETLKKLAQYPISVVYAGHGEDIYDHHTLIEKMLAAQHQRAFKVKEMLEQSPKTVFEICKLLFPKAYQKELSLTISETVAQLDYLLALDEITLIEDTQSVLIAAK